MHSWIMSGIGSGQLLQHPLLQANLGSNLSLPFFLRTLVLSDMVENVMVVGHSRLVIVRKHHWRSLVTVSKFEHE